MPALTADPLGPTGTAPAPSPSLRSERPGIVPRWWRGDESDPVWARPALLGLLLATLVLYTWNLTASGWANAFYSAAAQAGSQSWSALFFGSSDAANSITVDKPPASLWVMGLSVRLLGLNSFAILVPQALMGVAAVGVLHATVRRHFGAAAGLLAGAVLALTPVAALMFTFNNPDALLTLLMTLGAWATLRAIEQAAWRWFALAGVFLGLGFLTKTLQVLLVVPFLGIAYLVAAPTTLAKRVVHSLGAIGAMVLSAGWWVAIVELMPASSRPYIGGSQTNSFLELTFGYNGFGRLSGDETGSVGGGNGWGATGPMRMFGSTIGDQVSWLIPSALVLLATGLWLRGRRPRTDVRRAAYLVWGGWLIVTMLVFSFMAGIFHEYYTVALAPAIGALVGMGAVEAWERRSEAIGAIALAVSTASAAAWAFILLSDRAAYGSWLPIGVLAVGLVTALMFLALGRLPRRAVAWSVGGALVAALAGPATWTAATTAQAHTGSIVTAGPLGGSGPRGHPLAGGPAGGGRAAGVAGRAGPPLAPGGAPGPGIVAGPGGVIGPGGTGGPAGPPPGASGRPASAMGGSLLDASTPSSTIVAALAEDATSYTWVAAAVGSQTAAGLQLATGLPVMAVGGFNGSDPSPTLEQFQSYVAAGRVHYFVAGGMGGGFQAMGQLGGRSTSSEIAAWVEANFAAVTIDGSRFYDLTRLAGT